MSYERHARIEMCWREHWVSGRARLAMYKQWGSGERDLALRFTPDIDSLRDSEQQFNKGPWDITIKDLLKLWKMRPLNDKGAALIKKARLAQVLLSAA